ncbi:MAG: hypothetical protein HY719_18080 [Planctomycetes bacterium]|nr:hypothetical protein [Planctomycetota bacterium]
MPRLLFITSDFPPAMRGGGMRVFSIARWLPEFGWEMEVITSRPSPEVALDRDVAARLPPGLVVHRLPAPRPQRLGVLLERMGFAQLGRMALDLTDIPDERVAWFPFAALAAMRSLWDRGRRADAILASGGSWAGFLAARLAGALFDLPVIYDYRDLWTANVSRPGSGLRERLSRRLEDWCLSRAAGVTVANPGYPARIRSGRSWAARVPFMLLRNGFDDDDFDAEPGLADTQPTPGTRCFEVRCIGRQVATGDPSPYLAGLARFFARRPQARGRHLTRFIGERLPRFTALPARFGVESAVTWENFVSHRSACRLMASADALLELLVGFRPPESANTPGRAYEYLRAGRPVIAVVPATCDAAALVRDHRAGFVCPPSDPDAVTVALTTLWDGFSAGAPLAGADRATLDAFTRRDQMCALAAFLTRGAG